MQDEPLTICCNQGFDGAARTLLEEGTAAHRLVLSRSREALAGADVALGHPHWETVMASPRLRWVHLTSAGYTAYDRDDFRAALEARGALLTNSSHVYDEPCAQHVLAMLLALARRLPQSLDTQRTDRAWPSGERRKDSFLLDDQTVLLLGFGAIGRRLAQYLAPFGMRIVAVRRHVRGDEGEEVEIITEKDLDRVFPLADHVVNILPENDSTRGYVDASCIERMTPGALFYNIGRGATVDQDALMEALHTGQIGAAYLDVTDPEPLPPDHPLWTTPNCFITPHSAGGHAGEDERLVRHFLANLRAFERGQPLTDRII